MEKINVNDFPKYEGDFIKLPSTFRIMGFKSITYKNKKGETVNAPILVVKREDNVELQLFSDQLRKEGDALFVSQNHLLAQVARQEAYAMSKGAHLK